MSKGRMTNFTVYFFLKSTVQDKNIEGNTIID